MIAILVDDEGDVATTQWPLDDPEAAAGAPDAATRAAYDLEAGAKRFRKTPTVAVTVEHSPKAALLVWCQDSIAGPSVTGLR